ncbi:MULTISPECIES: ABC transporter substrate-binding protein [Ralstonia solanacearum species complex]|uniref:ABC transporter substrate-binding protein n=1 Tax=Ralstonia solanacearum species complex TaxID=3116862 RepID=UPI000E57BE18|nr:ABC transporter substrate-binding protein [Ralstonia solanacearum]BEU70665.1 ABC transporter substrate-binding protein [Ralstonia pseudosolanacearum]AXV75694.1 amino acid-binding protein [Ralstonia solanacearum]AXV89693.1 amino acid-binding protein [Ralstonia solanacearum]AXW17902.1 amino acid-binding protein [Ralstonia solanacearum]AXW74606.1 amino acid-binding protein [Ralstonia solanacearum]
MAAVRPRLTVLMAAAVLVSRPGFADVVTVAQVLPFADLTGLPTRAAADAAALYLRKVSKGGGVNGHVIRVVTVSAPRGLGASVRRTAETLRQYRPAALLNYDGAARTLALLESGVLAANHTPVIGALASSTPVRAFTGNRWVFYLRPGLKAEADRLVHQGVAAGRRRAAILYRDDAAGEDGMRMSTAALRALGLRPVLRLPLAVHMMDTPSLDRVAETVLGADADVILIFADSLNVGGFLRAYRERGGLALIATDSTPSAQALVRASSVALACGVHIAQPLPAPGERRMRLTRAFVADMRREGRPDLAGSAEALEGYASARLFVEVLRRIRGPVTGEAVRTALQTQGPFDLGGFEVNYGPSQYEGSRAVGIGVVGQEGRLMN